MGDLNDSLSAAWFSGLSPKIKLKLNIKISAFCAFFLHNISCSNMM